MSKKQISPDAYKQFTTFALACKFLKKDPKKLPIVKGLEKDFAKDLVARYKLMTVIKAINKIMGFVPTFVTGNTQDKYSLWYWLKTDKTRPSGFGFGFAFTRYDLTHTAVGPRLVMGTSEQCHFVFKHFRKECEDMVL